MADPVQDGPAMNALIHKAVRRDLEGFAAESHTEPVTVAAEQGIVGLLAYAGLLVVSFGALLSATGLELRRRARGTALAATLLAVYTLMFVHSLGYAAFLIAGAALLPAPRPSG